MAHRGQAPTLATVADEAGVSRQTVSNALNSPHLLRPETLERVRAAIERLGYSPNRAARNLRTRSSRLVGLRVERPPEYTANTSMDRFLHALVESCKDADYHVLLFSAEADEDPLQGYDELLTSAAVDAFVLTDTYRGNPQAPWLEQRGIPFVSFGRPWGSPTAGHPWVDVDGRAGVMLGVDHLVERGHSRIAWIGWQRNSYIGEDRRSGWVDRMHEHGLSTSKLSARGDDTVDFGRRAAHALLETQRPTAFLCASDTVALGVLGALAEAGLYPARDIAVVGFDDSVAAQLAPPGLTSVRPPLEKVAVEIVRLLGDRIAHRASMPGSCILPPTLSVRQTT